MSGLGQILYGDASPGVHRTDLEVAEVRAEAQAAGWTFAYVGGQSLATRTEVMVALGEALAFPSYFTGRSLDGLHDCLRDLGDPTLVVWDGWGTLADADPPALRRLLAVLAHRADADPPFEVLLRGEGPEDAAPAL